MSHSLSFSTRFTEVPSTGASDAQTLTGRLDRRALPPPRYRPLLDTGTIAHATSDVVVGVRTCATWDRRSLWIQAERSKQESMLLTAKEQGREPDADFDYATHHCRTCCALVSAPIRTFALMRAPGAHEDLASAARDRGCWVCLCAVSQCCDPGVVTVSVGCQRRVACRCVVGVGGRGACRACGVGRGTRGRLKPPTAVLFAALAGSCGGVRPCAL